MDLRLLFHNIGFGSGALIALVMAIFVYSRDKKSVTNITFCLAFISITVFCASHLIGVNIVDSIISRNVLMWNISVIYIACFITHCSFTLIGIEKKQRIFLIGMYAIAVVLTFVYVLFPDTYLLPSEPKMYFPNYYVAGSLQWIMRIIFDIIVPVYFLAYLFFAYTKADYAMKNRLKYFFVSLFVGYGLGSLAIPLVYNIQIDPIYASFFVPILAIPMAYSIVQYNLMDIRVIAKKALYFGAIITVASFGIFVIGNINYVIVAYIPNFPLWVMPLFGGFVATLIGFIVWNNFRETDLLKYEFITVVTHKLRMPLTSIKWSIENLSPIVPVQGKNDLEHIEESINNLVEITNIITTVSSENQEVYLYHYNKVDLVKLSRTLLDEYKKKFSDKNIGLASDFSEVGDEIFIKADPEKIKLTLQILLDNALTYNNPNGKVVVSLKKNERNVSLSVADNGIGMNKEDLNRLFSSFYRGDNARLSDTEGMGIGLYISKKIIERHHGSLKASSDGLNKGSTFTISLPIDTN